MIGTTLGHYRIIEKLGEGGMGVVYKAQDLHLDRPVALKILPREKVADPDRKRRFVQEAKAASALNHPHIVHIYDIDQSDGTDFIAMEFVAGKALDQAIPRRGMRLNEALKCAVQMADALAKAHAAGIVHRDLKPGNVMVTDEGQVKVLDFGLAKLTEAVPQGDDEPTRTVKPATEEGTIVGTVAYMSPEQAEGKKLDARSDIFSFGAVLYEMVTGSRAFQGDTRASTLAAVLKDEPKPPSHIAVGLPREVERLINRCLRKDPAKRFQHMDDVKVALEELKEESESGALAAVTAPPRTWRGTWVAIAVVAVVSAAGWFWVARSRVAPAEPPSAPIPLTTSLGKERHPSFSPDGKKVAFAWNGEKEDNYDIYVKQIDSPGSPAPLVTNPAPDTGPAWSPDDTWIASLRQEASGVVIVLTPPFRGLERALSAVGDVRPSLGALYSCTQLSWTPDGKWLAFAGRAPGEKRSSIWAVQVDTDERRRMTTPQTTAEGTGTTSSDSCPSFSPDGQWLAFARSPGEIVTDVYGLRLREDLQPAGEPLKIAGQRHGFVGGIAWTADGQDLVYSAGELAPSLWRVPVSGGQPLRLPYPNAAQPAIAEGKANRLAYTEWILNSNLWRLDTRTHERGMLVGSAGTNSFAQYSPDGSKIAFESDRSGHREIHTCDAEGQNCMQLTTMGGPVTGTPRWSPDSQWLAFDSRQEGQADIYVVSADGGKAKRVTRSTPVEHSMPTWSHDGRWIYYGARGEIWKVPWEGGEEEQVTHSGGAGPFVSPDGRYIYYVRNSTLFRMPTAGGDEKQILAAPVTIYSYTVSPKGVYFPSTPGTLQFLDTATGKVSTLATLDLRKLGSGLSVSPDDRYVVWSQTDNNTMNLKLIERFR